MRVIPSSFTDMRFRTRWVGAAVSLIVVSLITPAPIASAGNTAVKYPAYHRVQQGESMWSIAHDFLVRATGHEPADKVTNNEVRQMRRLNRDTLHGSDQIYPGQRLALAPSSWDVPDGKDGWGTGFTWCTNDTLPAHPSAPHRGLTLHVRLLEPPADKRSEPVRLVIHNGSDQTRRFTTQVEHGLLLADVSSAGAVMHSDGIGVAQWKLAPGETQHVDGRVASFVCGDTRYLDRRLPAGRYRLYGLLHWGASDHDGEWMTPPLEVRVVRN